MPFGVTAQRMGLRTFPAMTDNDTLARPDGTDPRHVFHSATEVIVRFGWGRTYGYQMLKSTGFPRPIGGRYRLDTVMIWEDRVLAGELTGKPDADSADASGSTSGLSGAATQLIGDAEPAGTSDCDHAADQDATSPDEPAGTGDTTPPVAAPVAAPRRHRTRGLRRPA